MRPERVTVGAAGGTGPGDDERDDDGDAGGLGTSRTGEGAETSGGGAISSASRLSSSSTATPDDGKEAGGGEEDVEGKKKAGFSLSTVTTQDLPRRSSVYVLGPLARTTKGPS